VILVAGALAELSRIRSASANPGPPAPTITRAPDAVTPFTSATFAFTDERPGAAFRCALDGAAFARCTSPRAYEALREGRHSFEVEAVDAGKTSPAAAHAWTVDSTPPPAPTLSERPPAATPSRTAIFTFGSSDPAARFLCSLDDGPMKACASPKTYGELPDGLHTFAVSAVDAAGNVGPATKTSWTVDTTAPPPPSVTGGPAAKTTETAATFTFSDAGPNTSLACSLDLGSFTACTSPTEITGLAPGKHTFRVRAIDAAGNASAPATYAWTVEAAPAAAGPTGGASPGGGTGHSGGTPSGESAAGSPTGSTGAGSTGGGPTGGGARPTAKPAADTTPPPVPAITSHPASLSPATTASFSFEDSEQGVTFVCLLDAGVFTACSSGRTYEGLGDGPHSFEVAAVDAAGNVGGKASFAWTVDSTPPPSPIVTDRPAGASNQSTASFAFDDVETGATFLCSVDGGAYHACTSPTAYHGLGDGSHTFRVEAVDAAGNVSAPAVVRWTADTTPPPAPSITAGPANPSGVAEASFSFTDSEPAVVFHCRLDGGILDDCASPQAYAHVADGSHSFQVVAVDAAGNTSPARTFAWTVDTTPPATPAITSGPPQVPGWTTTTTATFGFTGDADAAFLCSVDSASQASFTTCSSPRSYSGVPQGQHTFRVEARDAFGRLSGIAARQWQVDTIDPPTPVFTLTPSDPSISAISSFDWTPHLPAADVDHYECSKEGGAWQPCGPPPYTYAVQATNDGSHRFAVRAIDAAGNQSGSTEYDWNVGAGPGQDFTMGGNAIGLLYPGGQARPIAVTLHNPNGVPIYVTALTVTVADNPGGCLAAPGEMAVVQSNVSSSQTITVPANGSVTLPDPTNAPGVTAPTIRLLDTGVDQTPTCANRTFQLAYTGSAHS
jgi:hypothetical protein